MKKIKKNDKIYGSYILIYDESVSNSVPNIQSDENDFFVYSIKDFLNCKIEIDSNNSQRTEVHHKQESGVENKKINDAINAFAEGNCILFLGAGVSASAGIPLWNDLLKNMLDIIKAHS